MPPNADLGRVMELVDAALERVRRTDDLPCERWQILRKHWVDGIRTARACSEADLWQIKSALIDAMPPIASSGAP